MSSWIGICPPWLFITTKYFACTINGSPSYARNYDPNLIPSVIKRFLVEVKSANTLYSSELCSVLIIDFNGSEFIILSILNIPCLITYSVCRELNKKGVPSYSF